MRARVDLDAGRLALAAIELDRAYAAALVELGAERRTDLRERIEELAELKSEVEAAAHAALPKAAMTPDATRAQPVAPDPRAQARHASGAPRMPEEQVVRHALERLEAALRARTAAGFTVR